MYNNQAYTADNWRRDLQFVATRYAHLPYFFAIDIYNEPNGTVFVVTLPSAHTRRAALPSRVPPALT